MLSGSAAAGPKVRESRKHERSWVLNSSQDHSQNTSEPGQVVIVEGV